MEKMFKVEVWTVVQTNDGHAVLLRTTKMDIVIPIFIAELEFHSVLMGMEEIRFPRPMTHDLIMNILESQNLVLDRVEINEIKDSVFYAKLVISGDRQNGKSPLYLDCRPSDAICLATRLKCPVLVSAEVVDIAGVPIDILMEAMEDGEDVDFLDRDQIKEQKRHLLLERLARAVEREEYEEAAKIRDIINDMEAE